MKLEIEFKGSTEEWESQSCQVVVKEGTLIFRRGTRPSVYCSLRGGNVPVTVIGCRTGSEDKGPHILDGYANGYTHLVYEVEVLVENREPSFEERAEAIQVARIAKRDAFLKENAWIPAFLSAAYAADVNPLSLLRKMMPGQWDYYSDTNTVYAPGIELPVWCKEVI